MDNQIFVHNFLFSDSEIQMNLMSDVQIKKLRPLVFIVLSGSLYGFLGCLGKELFAEKFTLSSMLFWRFFIASLWMAGVFWIKKSPVFLYSEVRNFFWPFLLCAAAYGATSMLYFVAAKTAGTGLAMVVFFSYPLFVTAYGFYKTDWRIDRATFACSLAVPLGLGLLVDTNQAAPNTAGIAIAVLSALAYSIYILKSKVVLQAIQPGRFTVIVCVLSAMIFLGFAGIEGELSFPTTLKSFSLMVAFGVFATAIPIQLLLEGLKEVSALKASMASVLEPIVTLLIGVAFLSEPIGFIQITGVAIVLAASIFIQISKD